MTPAQADRRLRGCTVRVLDTETTGLTGEDGLVELAIVQIDALLERDRTEPRLVFHSLVDPGVPSPWAGTRVHGLDHRDTYGAPTWPELWPQVAPWLADPEVVLAGHNAGFDRRFLHSEGTPMPESVDWLDTAKILRRLQVDDEEERQAVKLEDACRARWIRLDGHRARTDALATAHLLLSLIREAYQLPIGQRPPALPTVGQWTTWQSRKPKSEKQRAPKVDPNQVGLFAPATSGGRT